MSRKIEKEITIDAPVDAVWRALTDAGELARWFPVEARVEPGVGGSIWLSWGGGTEGTAPITVWSEGERLQWTEDRGAVKMAVDFHLETRSGRTVVRLVQSGFGSSADWDDEFHMSSGGWAYFLANLRHYLERHRGVPRDLIAFREVVALARAEVFARLAAALETVPVTPLVESPDTFQLGVVVPALNDALVFVELEPHPTGARAGFWVSTYGLSADRLAAARTSLSALYKNALT